MEKELDPQIADFMSHVTQMQKIQSHLELEISLLEEIVVFVIKKKECKKAQIYREKKPSQSFSKMCILIKCCQNLAALFCN